MRPRVYVSGALMGASNLQAARDKYEICAKLLAEHNFVPYIPHQTTDPERAHSVSETDVFTRDADQLHSSDVVVAFLDEPSLGVGAELAMALAADIPIVALLSAHIRTSRFVLGMLKSRGSVATLTFSNVQELRHQLPGVIDALLLKRSGNLQQRTGQLGF